MLYKALKHTQLNFTNKETKDLDSFGNVVLVPSSGSKLFIHWLTDSGKIRQTYTMTFPTKIEGKVRLINGLDSPASVQVIHLD